MFVRVFKVCAISRLIIVWKNLDQAQSRVVILIIDIPSLKAGVTIRCGFSVCRPRPKEFTFKFIQDRSQSTGKGRFCPSYIWRVYMKGKLDFSKDRSAFRILEF
jgi:hypothetical protein